MLEHFIGLIARRAGIQRQLVFFLIVGLIGLSVDVTAFSVLHDVFKLDPFRSRALSLALATVTTWCLNRTVTFEATNRQITQEASRYVAVTCLAQGVSYLTFTLIVLTVPFLRPQFAMLIGAAAAACFSYNGHKWFSFSRIVQSR